jgi:regulator of sigma E protease
MTTVIIFLIVLAVLIFVHELGHFLFARWCGIRVDAFKIGFGPKIFAWRPKTKEGKRGETEYGLNLIPFGGYVKIFGETPDAESYIGVDRERSLVHKSKWQQILVLFGGVLFNFLFAVILYIGLFSHGVTATTDGFTKYSQYFNNPRVMITDVLKGSPAEKAGFKTGDVILAISTSTNPVTIDNVQKEIESSYGNQINIIVDRAGANQNILVTPEKGVVSNHYAVGIAMNDVADMKLPFYLAVYEGGHYAIQTLRDTVVGLGTFVGQIFEGKANFSEVTGPVGIAGIVGQAADLGMTYLLMITALISINLAVINLIPFPALDGGRILFVAIEAIIRRRIPASFANWTNLIGFALLMILMVIITYKDIIRLVAQ